MPQVTFTDSEAVTAIEVWSDRPEVRSLAELLLPGERIAFVGSGMLGAVSVRQRIIVLTDRRLLALLGTHPATRSLIEIPLTTVRSVRWQKGLLKAIVTVTTNRGKVRIYNMSKASAGELFGALSQPMEARAHVRRQNPLTWEPAPAAVAAEPPVLPMLPLTRPVVAVGHSITPSAETRLQRLEALTESLESEVAHLREQVAFLEELLQAKATN